MLIFKRLFNIRLFCIRFFILFIIILYSKFAIGLIAPDSFSPAYGIWPNQDMTQEREFIQPSTERTEEDLIKDGYQIIHQYSCVNFRGCYRRHSYILGEYKFVCDETNYHITFPCENVLVFSKVISHSAANTTTCYQYICAKNHYCYRGKLVPW